MEQNNQVCSFKFKVTLTGQWSKRCTFVFVRLLLKNCIGGFWNDLDGMFFWEKHCVAWKEPDLKLKVHTWRSKVKNMYFCCCLGSDSLEGQRQTYMLFCAFSSSNSRLAWMDLKWLGRNAPQNRTMWCTQEPDPYLKGHIWRSKVKNMYRCFCLGSNSLA